MIEQTRRGDSRRPRFGWLLGALGLILALFLLVGVVPADAQDDEMPPALPHYFAGTATTSNGPVSEGTTVEAWVEGARKADTTVTAQSTYELLVPGEYGDDGKTVSFTVGGVQASQTAAWVSGQIDSSFDLTISGLPKGNPFPFPLPFDCFVATAAYGTGTAEEIDLLREFRNLVLLDSDAGAKFVSLYYQVSPPVAEVISRHEFLKTAVRVGFIDPIVAILAWTHTSWLNTD